MDRNIVIQLELVNRQIKELAGVYQNALSHKDISVNEFWIWYTLLIIGGEYSQQDICCAWSLSKQTVNTIITNMVKRGFAVLETVPGTRNRKNICLTEAGRIYGENIVRPVFNAEQRAFAKLSKEERTMFIKILGNYVDYMKTESEALIKQQDGEEDK